MADKKKSLKRKNSGRLGRSGKTWFIIAGVFTVIGIAAVLFVLSVYVGVFGKLQSREDLLGFKNATSSLVLAEDGEIIGRFFSENRTNVSLDQIPSHLVNALIATEDVRFFRHRGIDARSVLRVMVKTILFNDRGSGGGSTISQQLVKNIFGRGNFGLLTAPVNKTRETILARRVENTFSKEEILTIYLNTVSFGENVYGIEAASRRFFNKRVEDLNIDESAVLIGMLKANTLYNPRLYPENARFRRNVVFLQMERYGYIDPVTKDSLAGLPLAINYSNLEARNPAGYFLVQVKNEAERILQAIDSISGKKWNIEEDGLIIHTSLNFKLQNYAIQSFREHLPAMQKRLHDQYGTRSGEIMLSTITQNELRRLNMSQRAADTIFLRNFSWEGSRSQSMTVLDSIKQALTLLHGGLLVLDPFSGEVKTWVGGIDHLTQPFDQILARRQMASAFKPVLYAAALEQGIEPCRYYDNDSIVLAEYENWTPVNYDRSYGGKYSLQEALARSMNIPTFNLFLEVDFTRIYDLWRDLGFAYPLHYSPSLSLGTAEANILETAVAYAAFANGGFRVRPHSIKAIFTPEGEMIYEQKPVMVHNQVVSERTCLIMRAMLEKAVNEGTGVSLRNLYGVDIPLAGKTGTSQNYADAWFAAFNHQMVIVSRVGASSRAIHFTGGNHGSGSALALPLVALTLHKVRQDGELAGQFTSPFPELPHEIVRALNCDRLHERNVFNRFLDVFKRDETGIELRAKEPVPEKPGPEKPSLLRRIFRKNNN
jgi:penicillin-binding protein 1A